uniref:Uncharacterized protein n=1 Tax=Oryza punctata TaxID=4537 RepID=A0A0E0KJT0_ORYPU
MPAKLAAADLRRRWPSVNARPRPLGIGAVSKETDLGITNHDVYLTYREYLTREKENEKVSHSLGHLLTQCQPARAHSAAAAIYRGEQQEAEYTSDKVLFLLLHLSKALFSPNRHEREFEMMRRASANARPRNLVPLTLSSRDHSLDETVEHDKIQQTKHP